MSTVIQSNIQLTDVVIDYIAIMKRLYHKANQPNFSVADWAPLAELVMVDDFEWVSHHRDVLSWGEYIRYLTQWAQSMTWESTVRRIHQWQNVVFLEHDERYTFDDKVDGARSISVFEFNPAGKIHRVAVYLQQKPSLGL